MRVNGSSSITALKGKTRERQIIRNVVPVNQKNSNGSTWTEYQRGSSSRTTYPGKTVVPGWTWVKRLWISPCPGVLVWQGTKSSFYCHPLILQSDLLAVDENVIHVKVSNPSMSTPVYVYTDPNSSSCCSMYSVSTWNLSSIGGKMTSSSESYSVARDVNPVWCSTSRTSFSSVWLASSKSGKT